jgi:uncharacterized phosphosugar-binding protein
VYAEQFLDAIIPQLERLRTGQLEPIRRAGSLVAGAIAGGHRVWIAQTTHCLHGEATYRAGGFMAAHILEDPIVLERGDVVVEGTPAGTSGLAVETAIAAKARGAALIALTQLVYEQDPRIVLQHPSGRRLHELADVVVDLGGCFGDGELDLPGEDVRILPSSGITAMTAMWMIFAEAVEQLIARGLMPLMWQSILVPGATERNERLRERYLRDRAGYVSLDETAR